ncbi:MAG TPA: SUMF1/EgtB/PvdO family nonheme iron enzyme [Ottowia sp.]|nr:SUMF1/EgtB/PvdO family nonheme iron enzyme [Ottowia sp.]HMT64947.1 SUMF1/EgtB/PvdO family nonheme iron enzyme [Ottowia sp.]
MKPLGLGLACFVIGLLTTTGVHAQQVSSRNALGIAMVTLPAGSFRMGSCLVRPERDVFLGRACENPDHDAKINETPQHVVNVPTFQLAKTEVTLRQFKQFIVATGRESLVDAQFMQHNNQGDSSPVVRVSWNDAQEFVRWLNQVDGGGWRLPSEAEWEYACRTGGAARFCSVSANESVSAWTADNSGGHQHPVGLMLPNAWGLHDMSGNAWEWVQDCWSDNYAGAPTDGSAVQSTCNTRVLRGGAANSAVWETRSATRTNNAADYRGNLYGFRLARSVR